MKILIYFMQIKTILLIIFILLVREILVFIEIKKYFKILSIDVNYTEKEKIILLDIIKMIKWHIEDAFCTGGCFTRKYLDRVYDNILEIQEKIELDIKISNEELEYIKQCFKIFKGGMIFTTRLEIRIYERIFNRKRNVMGSDKKMKNKKYNKNEILSILKELKFFIAFIVFILCIGISIISFVIFGTNYMVKKVNNMNEEYKKNIIVEVKEGQVVDSFKEVIPGILGGDKKYETAIKIGDEIIISNDKNIYYEAIDHVGEEIEVEIEDNKNTGSKKILDIK